MRKVVVGMSVSLDGFVGGPHAEVDWAFATIDDELKAWIVDSLWQAGVHVMGRTTYLDMAAYWPSSQDAYARPMNEIPKTVFSRTLKNAEWSNSRIARGDLATEIARLKQQPGKDVLVHGGASLVQSLARLGLVDEYRLRIHPVALGDGLPLFKDLPHALTLRLVSATTFDTGAVVHIYRPV